MHLILQKWDSNGTASLQSQAEQYTLQSEFMGLPRNVLGKVQFPVHRILLSLKADLQERSLELALDWNRVAFLSCCFPFGNTSSRWNIKPKLIAVAQYCFRIDTSNTISDVGLYGSIAGAGGLYLLGSARHNDHLAETGRLGEEAIINALLVVAGLKLATNRERPNEGNGRGGFWPQGTRQYETDGSFPSGHAAATWAVVQVIASEYPSKPVQFGAYGFALAISASRVTAREHFPSDVLVGGTFGYLIGRYVVHYHADSYKTSAFSVNPLMQASTRTLGLHVDLTPGNANLSTVGRLLGRTRGAR